MNQPNIIIQGVTLDELVDRISVRIKADIQTPSSKGSEKNILTVEEVADYLRKSKATIYRMTSGRMIPFMKKGNSVWFDKKEIDAWLTASKKISVESL